MGDPKGGDDLELSALFEALPQALLVIDAGGQVCRANPRAVQLLGRRPPRGAPLDDHLLLLGPDGAPIGVADAAAAPRVDLPLDDGAVLPVEVAVVPLADGHELVTLTDISERLQQRAAVEQARFDAEVARQAERTRADFLARMSHELRTPLNAILGYAELIRDELYGREEDVQQDLTRIHGAGRHLLGLINDILDLSKVDAGRMEARPEAVDFDRLLFDVVDDIRPIARKNGTRVFVSGKLPGVARLDPTRVRQVLYNLLSNACRYTVDGRIDVWVRTRTHPRPRLLVAVADTGIGIPPEELESIFEPFQQGSRSRGGTGLGLALVRSLCELMGGRAYAKSKVDEGSMFTVELPWIEADPSEVSRTATPVGRR